MSWCLLCKAAAAPDPSRSPATTVQHPCLQWTQRPQTTGCGCRRLLASCCWRCAADPGPCAQPAHSPDSGCHRTRPRQNNRHHCLHTVLAPETLYCIPRKGPLGKRSTHACTQRVHHQCCFGQRPPNLPSPAATPEVATQAGGRQGTAMGTKLNRWVMWLACVKLYVGRDELLEGPDLLVAAAAPPAASAGGAGGAGAGAWPVGLACASGEGTAAAGAAEPAGNANACLDWGCYKLKCSESGQPLSHQEQGCARADPTASHASMHKDKI